jgi:hypothetical protein
MSGSNREVVVLKGGVTVPVSAIELGLQLEDKGVTLVVRGDALGVHPAARLTDDDRVRIRKHRDGLKVIATYDADAVM